MTQDEETALCDEVAKEAANLIVERLAAKKASGLTVPLTAEKVSVALLIKAGNDPGVIGLFCQRVAQITDEFRRKKMN